MKPGDWVTIGFATLFGACIGSFLNVCIWRLPRPGLSISSPRRSHCPSCGAAIDWFDNIPILSWILLGARCRSCKLRISARYPLIEALAAFLIATLAYQYLPAEAMRWREFLVLSALTASLIVASAIDIDLRIIPDEITVPGMMVLPAIAFLAPGLHTLPVDPSIQRLAMALEETLRRWGFKPRPDWPEWQAWGLPAAAAVVGGLIGLQGYRLYRWKVHPQLPNRLRDGLLAGILFATGGGVSAMLVLNPAWAHSPLCENYLATVLGMGAGSGFILGVGIFGKLIFRKEAMGFGDVKLMGLLGGVAGWKGALGGFAIACLLGSLVGIWRLWRYRTRYLWFGPFLSLGCLLIILFPGPLRAMLDWYMSWFR